MATRLRAALLAAVFVAGCGGPSATLVIPTGGPIATAAIEPFTPAVDAARAVIAGRLAAVGFRLEPPVQAYTPGQPPSLQETTRAVYRVNLIDPNAGYVVIYDMVTSDAALHAGADFAGYLRTFGRSNYPADAQFTLNAVDSALVFTWWAGSRTSDPDRARAAFEVISGVGQRIDV